MSIELYINNRRIDIEDPDGIVTNFQVNDLAEIQDRNVSYTNTIKLPKTSNNVRVFEFLGVTGNLSLVPYKKVNVRLTVSTIEIIREGVVAVQDTEGRYYRVVLLDGLRTLSQALDGRTLQDLDFSDLNHTVTTANVSAALAATTGYTYAIGDFGGAIISANRLNAYRLFPSVFKHTLWQKIFDLAGFDFSGSFFASSVKFNSSVIPAIEKPDRTDYIVSLDDEYGFLQSDHVGPDFTKEQYFGYRLEEVVGFDYAQIGFPNTVTEFTVNKTGLYKITLSASYPYFNAGSTGSSTGDLRFKIAEDHVDQQDIGAFNGIDEAVGDPTDGELTTFTIWQQLTAGSVMTILSYMNTDTPGSRLWIDSMFFTVEVVTDEIPYTGLFDFNERMIPIGCMDFLKAVMQQYGLVAKQTGVSSYQFERIDDIFNGDFGFVDWTEKLVEQDKEQYRLDFQAKENKAIYQYIDDDDKDFADGSIEFDSFALPESKTMLDSNFATAKSTSLLDDTACAALPLYDDDGKLKEIEDPVVLDTILHEIIDNTTLDFADYPTGTNTVVISAGTDVNYLRGEPLFWPVLLSENYPVFEQVMSRVRVKTLKLLLNLFDIKDLDFFKLVYFKQYQSFFYLNKISNWSNGRECSAELVQVSRRSDLCGYVVNGEFKDDFTEDWSVTIVNPSIDGFNPAQISGEDTNYVIEQTASKGFVAGRYICRYEFEKSDGIQWSAWIEIEGQKALFLNKSTTRERGSIEFTVTADQAADFNVEFAISGEFRVVTLLYLSVCRIA